MTNTPHEPVTNLALTALLSRILGSRRTARLRRVMRHTGLPPEVPLDLAIELLDIASRKLAPEPLRRNGRQSRRGAVAPCQSRGAQQSPLKSRPGALGHTPPITAPVIAHTTSWAVPWCSCKRAHGPRAPAQRLAQES